MELFTVKKLWMVIKIIATMQQRPSLKERASTTERITNKIINFVETFISGFAS